MEIIILKFLIAFTQLDRLSTELKTCKKAKSIQIQDQAFRLMREIIHHYFNADEYMLPLSNSKLQDSLEEKQDCQSYSEDIFQLLSRAKNDPTLWDEGLSPLYSKFLSIYAIEFFLWCLCFCVFFMFFDAFLIHAGLACSCAGCSHQTTGSQSWAADWCSRAGTSRF